MHDYQLMHQAYVEKLNAFDDLRTEALETIASLRVGERVIYSPELLRQRGKLLDLSLSIDGTFVSARVMFDGQRESEYLDARLIYPDRPQ